MAKKPTTRCSKVKLNLIFVVSARVLSLHHSVIRISWLCHPCDSKSSSERLDYNFSRTKGAALCWIVF